MYLIKRYFKNRQKNWYNGTKTNFKEDIKFLGNIYSKITIEEINNLSKYVGYSNGKKYSVFEIDKNDNTIGLTEIEGYVGKVWCTFDKINKRK